MNTKLTALLIVAAIVQFAQAGDHKRERDERLRKEHHSYIIERQQVYQVQGVPTQRLISGKREIDVYRNGLMFERNNVVGVQQGR